MKRTIRKLGLGLLVGATVILGGGFASADYGPGDSTAGSSFDITYTVSSFRALELSDTGTVAFGTIRQGEALRKNGPTILYGTTWPTDEIVAYLDDVMANKVVLMVDMGAPTDPNGEVTCTYAGDSHDGVDLSLSYVDMQAGPTNAEVLIDNIDNCGAPGYSDPETWVSPDVNSDQWASASTEFVVDASNAEQEFDGNGDFLAYPLYQEMNPTVNFLIQAMG